MMMKRSVFMAMLVSKVCGTVLVPSQTAQASMRGKAPPTNLQRKPSGPSVTEVDVPVQPRHIAPSEPQALRLSASAVLEDLWGGYEFPDGSFNFEALAMRAPNEPDVHETAPHVQVMGLQNSGTELLSALLYLNFGYKLNYHTMPRQPHQHKGVWPHANLKVRWGTEEGKDGNRSASFQFDNTTVKALIMVRNPLAWMRAMRVNPPRELRSCAVGKDWLTKSCTHPVPAGYDSKADKKEFSSLGAIWNQWNDGYHNATQFGIPAKLVISYENLVRDPEPIMLRIAKFLNIEQPPWNIYPDNDNGHGQTSAASKVRNKMHLGEFTDDELKQACNHIDKTLMRLYSYDDDCHPGGWVRKVV